MGMNFFWPFKKKKTDTLPLPESIGNKDNESIANQKKYKELNTKNTQFLHSQGTILRKQQMVEDLLKDIKEMEKAQAEVEEYLKEHGSKTFTEAYLTEVIKILEDDDTVSILEGYITKIKKVSGKLTVEDISELINICPDTKTKIIFEDNPTFKKIYDSIKFLNRK